MTSPFQKFFSKLQNRKSSRRLIKNIAVAIPRLEKQTEENSKAIHSIESQINDISQAISVLAKTNNNLQSHILDLHLKLDSINNKTLLVHEKLHYRGTVTEELLQILNTLPPKASLNSSDSINKQKFLLFHYALHMPIFQGYGNLGDYVQTIAVRNALQIAFGHEIDFDFWDRDCLSFYSSEESRKITCVMQAWLSHTQSFFPSGSIVPVWLGTHFDSTTRNYLEKVFCIRRPRELFTLGIGCRDLTTLSFCKKHNIDAYLSRCLTLTLPKRSSQASQTKVFLVNIPSHWEQFIPVDLHKEAERIDQRWPNLEHEHWKNTYIRTEQLLSRYRNEARLVITTALHVASPCLAMGIPVILIADNPNENFQRFSALSGLIKPYTIEELQSGLVDFNPKSFNIEDLKDKMLKNLELSIRQSWGEKISSSEIQEIRNFIQQYRLTDH